MLFSYVGGQSEGWLTLNVFLSLFPPLFVCFCFWDKKFYSVFLSGLDSEKSTCLCFLGAGIKGVWYHTFWLHLNLWDRVSHSAWSLPFWLNWAQQAASFCPSSSCPVLGCRCNHCAWLFCGCRDLNSGPQACIASTVPTEPFPRLSLTVSVQTVSLFTNPKPSEFPFYCSCTL